MSDSLFGADGTELPEVLPDPTGPDPTGPGARRDMPELPPLVLPPIPDASMLRDRIAAVLGEEDPVESVDSDDRPVAATQPSEDPPTVEASLPPSAAPHGGGPPSGGAPAHRPAGPLITAVDPPPRPSPRGIGRLRYRSPLAGASREPVPQVDFSRRTSRRGPVLPLRPRSNGGAGIALFIGLIIAVLLVYYTIAEIVQSFVRLIPW